MGCPGATSTRTVFSNHSDDNLYAEADPAPTLRHFWNPNHTLPQGRQRFGEDQHSKLAPVSFEFRGAGFKLLSHEDRNTAGPLPDRIGWQLPVSKRVGASISQWP